MSKLDDFNNAAHTYFNVKENLYRAMKLDENGNENTNNDKGMIQIIPGITMAIIGMMRY
jgi:hypothetical protein